MSTIPEHITWLVDTKKVVTTREKKRIKVYEFQHQPNESVLSEWAKHFRNHYCLDEEIDYFRRGYKLSRKDYLNTIKFPDRSTSLGPSTRAGDFGEVLAADYLEFIMNYWVPRTRYANKTVRDESTKGSDIIGFYVIDQTTDSLDDTLAIFESKTQFSGKEPKEKLQHAVNDSAKDHLRRGESLNAIKQRLYDKGFRSDADLIERFQNLEDRPYKEIFGAVAIVNSTLFDESLLRETITKDHPYSTNIFLLAIHGNQLMDLVHELYRRAADEA